MDLKDKKAAEQLNTTSQTTGKSYVQKFFKKEGENSAKCNICLKVYVFKTGGPTSSLKRHLDEKHREILKVNEKKEPKQQRSDNCTILVNLWENEVKEKSSFPQMTELRRFLP